MSKRKSEPLDWVVGVETPGEDDTPEVAANAEATLLPLQGDDEAAPSSGLWERIAAKVDEAEAIPGTMTIPMSEGTWEPLAPGIERKVVHLDRQAGTQSCFLRMRAGAVLPPHDHGADEHCVVMQGDVEVGGKTFGAGAYHLASKGTPHLPITARSDAVLFIHGAL